GHGRSSFGKRRRSGGRCRRRRRCCRSGVGLGLGSDRCRGREQPRAWFARGGGFLRCSLGGGSDLGGFLVGDRGEGRHAVGGIERIDALDLVAVAAVAVTATAAAAAARLVAFGVPFLALRAGGGHFHGVVQHVAVRG